MRIGILGGGLTGVELGKKLHEKGVDFVIFERDHEVGGLCRTLKTGDYLWDYGVHAMYSRSKAAMDYFQTLPLKYQHSNRNVRICHWGHDGKIYEIDYPFENGLCDLPIEEKADCLEGYVTCAANNRKSFDNLLDWIENCLGFGIAKYFMLPYNAKIWNCDMDKISMGLVSKKIEPAPIRTIIKNCLGARSVGREYQAKFIYPIGGIGLLGKAIAEKIMDRVHLNSPVKSLEKTSSGWTIIADGKKEKVDRIVSTIPLTELLKMVNLPTIPKQSPVFHHNDTHFYLVGLKSGKKFHRFANCHWIFYAGPEVFYRLTIMNNYDESMPPAIVAEITNKGKYAEIPVEKAKKMVVEDLVKSEVIESPNDVAVVDHAFATHTYPIPSVGLDEVKEHLKTELPKHGIHLLGRNGGWDYINMDGVIEDVKKFLDAKTLF